MTSHYILVSAGLDIKDYLTIGISTYKMFNDIEELINQ
jgi:hypothetical protein